MRDASGLDASVQLPWIGGAALDYITEFSALDAELDFDPIVRSIAERSQDVIMLLDRGGFVRFINRTVPNLSIDEVVGQQVLMYVPPAQREHARDHYERVAMTAEPALLHSDYYGADGARSHWVSRIHPFMRDGRVIGFVVLAREVTLLAEPAPLHDDPLFELCDDLLCVLGADGRFVRVNGAFERALGYSRHELLGRRLTDYVHPADLAGHPQAAAGVGPWQTVTFENRVRRRDGEYRLFAWRIRQSESRTFAAARDLSALKLPAAEQPDLQRLDAVGRMTTGVVHDFGNLLQAVRLATGTARQRAGFDAVLGSALDDIERAAERAGELVQRLLAYARNEPPVVRPVDLNRLCHGMLPLLQRLLPNTIEVALALSNQPCIASAERAPIEQVLLNLCLNARDAMPEGGVLRIATASGVRADDAFCREHPRAARGSTYTLLSVEDNGAGMSEEVQARVFEPFFSTKPKGRGNGVGLATARDTVDRYGGLCRVYSSEGLGSVFEVYLPEAQLEPAAFADAELPAPAASVAHGTILLAEDEELVRVPLRELLEQAGYRVVCARDGQEAVDLYLGANGAIDLLLLDIAMPRLSGPQVLAELRKHDRGVRALFTSGYDRASSQGEACEGGEMLQKPYDSATLLRRIAETIAARAVRRG